MKYFLFLMHGFLELFKKKEDEKSLIEYAKKENFEFFIEKGLWGYVYLGDKLEKGYFNFFSKNNFPGEGFLRSLKYGIEIEKDNVFFLSQFLSCSEEKIIDTDINLTNPEKEALIKEISKNEDFEFFIVGKDMILKFKEVDFPYQENSFPNAIKNRYIEEILYKNKKFEKINRIMKNSIKILTEHPVNKVRSDLNEQIGNFLYIYGMGKPFEKENLSEIIDKQIFYYGQDEKINGLKEFFLISPLTSFSNFQDNSLYLFDFSLPSETSPSIWVKKFEIFEKEFLNSEMYSENSRYLFIFDPFFEENREYEKQYALFLAGNFSKRLKRKYKKSNLLFEEFLK